MKQITDMSSGRKNKDRLNIELDGSFAFAVEYTTAVKFGLKVGKTLTQQDIDAIYAEESETAAFNRGLKYAVKKTVSEKQMRDYLKRNEFPEAVIETAIQKLKIYGYVNDMKFAQAYVATYASERGAKRIEFELKNAGVDAEIIENALSETDESESCDRCVEKYLRTHANIDKQKLIKYLLYRGFDWDSINEAINRSDL